MNEEAQKGLLWGLVGSSVFLMGAGVLCAAGVAHIFLDITVVQWREKAPGILLGGAVASLVFFLPVFWVVRGVERFTEGSETDRTRLEKSLVTLQGLPYFNSRLMFLFWCVWALVFALYESTETGVAPFVFIMAGASALVLAVAESLLITAWHKRMLSTPLLRLQTKRLDLVESSLTQRHSIRFQVARALGGLIFFACGISLIVTFAQQQSLVMQLVSDHMHHELRRVQGESTEGEIKSCELGERDSEDPLLVVVVDDKLHCATRPGAFESTAPAPWAAIEEGPVWLGVLDLVGWAEKLEEGTWVLVVTEKPSELVSSIRLLLIFFTLLFVFSAGLVAVVSRDLTSPVLDLTRRVRQFAAEDGPLNSHSIPVRSDELGELTIAFERMGESLAERIKTIEDLNISLETTVQERTRELRESQEQLVRSEKMASLGQLVAGVAHEINNPLNSVLNNLEPLGEKLQEIGGPPTDEANLAAVDGEAIAEMRDMLALIAEGANRAAKIVEALRAFSHSGRFQRIPTALDERINIALELLAHRIPEKVHIERLFEPIESIPCDSHAIDQVLVNLLTNALDAVFDEAKPLVRVGIRAEDGDWVALYVTDNGVGISDEDRSRVFDPFFTTKEVGQGTGLGLSIAHTLIERHGGRIVLESELGQGTTVTVILPVK